MDPSRAHYPNSRHQHRHSPYKRERDDRGKNHRESESFKSDRHQNQSQGFCEKNPPSPQSLNTSKAHYLRDFPVYKQPVEVGCFSLDSERRFFNDSRQMRYYVEPDKHPNFDLRDGYRDRFIKRDESVKENLDHILRWILANRSKVSQKSTTASSNALDVDFVTWRGHLTKLLTTPYESRDGWLLAVSRFRGTLYISEVDTIAARMERENRSERLQEMTYWGYKFEQYICADGVHSSPDPGGVVNTNEAFCTVVRTRLADHRLLFGGEVDCRDKDPNAPAPPACYVELKTSAEICTPQQQSNFHRFKLIKWWAQSFLPGVPRIVAGFRDQDGVVVAMETIPVSKISQLIKNEQSWWKPTVCMNFCLAFLSFVKRVVCEDDPSVVYRFSFTPHRDVTYTVCRDGQYSFLPPWYVREMSGNPD